MDKKPHIALPQWSVQVHTASDEVNDQYDAVLKCALGVH